MTDVRPTSPVAPPGRARGRPAVRRFRTVAWLVYLAVGMLALGAYLFVPGLRLAPLFNCIGLSAPAAIVLGARLHRPAHHRAWTLIAIAQIVFVAGDVVTYNYVRFFGIEAPFPSVGDLLYLSVYPFLVAGMILLVRQRSPGRDRASLIDSLIIGIGVGTLSWVFLIAPYVHDPTMTIGPKVVAMAYPVMDLGLLTIAVRLAVGAGDRPPSFILLLTAVALLFVTDSIYGWIVLHGTYNNSTGYLEGGWGLFYLLLGAASLHPSMVRLTTPGADRGAGERPRRLVMLTLAAILAPAINIVQSLRHEPTDVPVVAAAGAVVFVLVLVRLSRLMVSVTEYRRTTHALADAEARYRSLVEGLPAIVYIADFGEDAEWRYISPRIHEILGFSPEEFRSAATLWRERIVPEDRQRALDAERHVLRGEGRLHTEYRILAKDGHEVWIREEGDALRDDDGRPLYLQGVMFDITEAKKAEAQLMRSLQTEKEASARIRALNDMEHSFLQAVSHDLRTPLTSIIGSALTLERTDIELSTEQARGLIGGVARNARKLHRLVTDLLDLDRITRGVIAPRRSAVSITSIISNVLEEMSVGDHPIQIETEDPVMALVDGAQVERIVENLVANALRYTPLGTPVWVAAERVDDGVLLRVDDAGPGVPPEVREQIWEPFRQGNDVAHSPGVGVGLSLVARFAELHDGRAWVEDRPGGGASFRVLLRDRRNDAVGESRLADREDAVRGASA